MDAGRGLDAEVGKAVFGYEITLIPNGGIGGQPYSNCYDHGGAMERMF
jgi:hypothetical protein